MYQQIVQGATATDSGLLLLPMMAAAMLVSVVVGRAITRTGRYKIHPVLGGTIMVVGTWLLSTQGVDTPAWQTGVYIAVLGVGMGFLMQVTLLIAQNSVEQRDLGVASSAATFFRAIGGSFGVSLFGAIFSGSLLAGLTQRFGAEGERLASTGGRLALTILRSLPPAAREGILEPLATAISDVFWWAILFAAAVPILAAFIKEVPLRGSEPAPEAATEESVAVRD